MGWKEREAMADTSSRLGNWTYQRALMLMAFCLLAGIAGGWGIRGIHPASADPARVVSAPPVAPANTTAQAPSPTQLKVMADNQAASQILKLKSDPKNLELLTNIGNVYYDAQQYPTAIDYYGRVLQLNASDAPCAPTWRLLIGTWTTLTPRLQSSTRR